MPDDLPGATIFVNLPVADVERAMGFWAKVGYGFDPQLSSQDSACLVLSPTVRAMLLRRDFFATFTDKQVADARRVAQTLLCLSAPSAGAVDAVVDRAVAAGAREPRPPMTQPGMRGRAFEDLDGHVWEILWMEGAAS
jgi:predicted lactoylglutathione lyase